LRNPKPFPNYYGNVLGVGGIPNPSRTLPKKTLRKHDSIPIMSSEILPKAVWERFGRRGNPKTFPCHSGNHLLKKRRSITFNYFEKLIGSYFLYSFSKTSQTLPIVFSNNILKECFESVLRKEICGTYM